MNLQEDNKFNYTPCTDGCVVSKSLEDILKERKKNLKKGKQGYESVEKDILEDFIKNATNKLVLEMRIQDFYFRKRY